MFHDLRSAVQALGAMPEGFCFCSSNRIGDDSKHHEPECADLRAALAAPPSDVERMRSALSQLQAFVGVMFGRGADAVIPETVPTPIGPAVKLGEIMREVEAALATPPPAKVIGALAVSIDAEELAAEVERLRAAGFVEEDHHLAARYLYASVIEPFAKAAAAVEQYDPGFPEHGAALRPSFDFWASDGPRRCVTFGDLKRARSAFENLAEEARGGMLRLTDALPELRARLTEGEQFNAYEYAAGTRGGYLVGIGPVTDVMRLADAPNAAAADFLVAVLRSAAGQSSAVARCTPASDE